MDFQPLNSDHAVQSAVFTIAFDGIVPSLAVQALGRNRDLIAELPAVQNPEGVEFNITGAAVTPAQRRITGVQLAHLRPDGTPAWALRMLGQELAVECTRYTRWAKIWETANRYLSAGLDVLRTGDKARKIAVFGHVVVDQFVANREDYDLRELFRENRFLASNSFVAGPAWHNHVGWFEPVAHGSPAWLNQLNLDGVRDPNTGKLIVQITHNQEMRFSSGLPIATLGSALTDAMNTLHANNKRVLYEILATAMAKQIGLTSDE